MKILVLTSTYPRSQDDTLPGFVHELSRRLVEAGHEIDVIGPRLPGGASRQVLDHVRVHRFAYWFRQWETLTGEGGIVGRIRQRPWRAALIPPFMLCFAVAIVRALRRQHYDLVHAHWIIPQGVLASVMVPMVSNVPVICTAHGSDVHAMRGPAFRSLRTLVARRTNTLTVVSDTLREQLIEEGVSGAQIAVAPMGIDFDQRFNAVPGTIREPHHVAFVGRLVPGKGVRILLDAVADVHRDRPDIRLTIIGDGPEREALTSHARMLGMEKVVRFEGALPQAALPAYYGRASIAVVPSLAEGFGLVTLEAMGCGCAVIASDLPALRALVTHEKSGLLFPVGNAALLAGSLRRLLDDPVLCNRLGTQGRAAVVGHFDWSVAVNRYLRLYERVHAEDDPARKRQ